MHSVQIRGDSSKSRLQTDFLRLFKLIRNSLWKDLESELLLFIQHEYAYGSDLINQKDRFGNTLLCYAAPAAGSENALRLMLELGVKVDSACGSNELLLSVALADNPHGVSTLPQFELLLEATQDMDQDGVSGGDLPLLHYLVKEKKLKFVESLLRHGADPNKLSRVSKMTAYDVARKFNKQAMSILAAIGSD